MWDKRRIKARMISAQKEEKLTRVPQKDVHASPSGTDPLGSYTGVPLFGGEPEQDADDL